MKLQDFAILTNETLEILIASISPKPNENEDNRPELESKPFIFLHMAVDMEEDSVSITANNPNFELVELHKKRRLSSTIIENLLPYLFSFNRFKNQLSFSFRIETGNIGSFKEQDILSVLQSLNIPENFSENDMHIQARELLKQCEDLIHAAKEQPQQTS